jgi:hypothetical protein
MKPIVVSLLFVLVLSGCKKAIEEKQKDLIIQAMTNGQWIITNFVYNGTTKTDDFNGYKFQYYSNKTVDAIKIGLVEKQGTWDGDAASMTTWANFDAGAPLSMINGTWHIDNSSWTFVLASQNVGGDTKIMRLDKL